MKHSTASRPGSPGLPFDRSFWVKSGALLAGYYPGDLDAESGALATCVRHPILDCSVPTVAEMTAILDEIDAALERGDPVYVHCWGGRGRTGTVVGCWLARHGVAPGRVALDKIDELRSLASDRRKPAPETEEQRRMVMDWDTRDMV